jgi:tetratricopeptide (TPR) repeat protein
MAAVLVALVFPLISSRYHLERGLAALGHDDEKMAIAEFNEAIRINSTSSAAFDQRGQLYLKKGDKAKALSDFTEALKWSPYNKSVLGRRAGLLLSNKQFTEALADYDKLLALDPRGQYFLYGNRAIAHSGLRDYPSAIDDYTQALKLAPGNSSLYLGRAFAYGESGRYSDALEDCIEAIQRDPNNSVALLKCGWCYQKMGSLDKAREQYNIAIGVNSRSAECFIYRGYCLLEQEKPSEAMLDFNEAITLNSEDARPYLGRAKVYELRGEYQNALSDLAIAVNVDPNVVVEASARCGAINQKMGNYRAAIANYTDVLEHQPLSQIYLERALCLDASGEPELASKDCDEAIRIKPADQIAYLRRAQFNKELGRNVSAQQDLEQALRLDPRCYDAYFERGSLYLSLHEYEKASNDFSEAVKLKPESSEATEQLKLAMQAVKDSRSITEHCIITDNRKEDKEAVHGPPASADVDTLLKSGYHDLFAGKLDDATLTLVRAVKKQPNDPRARRYLAYALLNQDDEKFEAIKQFEVLQQLRADNKDDQIALSDVLKSVDRVKDAVVVLQKCFESNPFDLRVKGRLNAAQSAFEQCGGNNLKLATKSNCDVSPLLLRTLAAAKPEPKEEEKEPAPEQNNIPPQVPGQTPNIQG